MRPVGGRWGGYANRSGFGNASGFRLGPAGPVPPAVRGLIIANVAVYLFQIVTGRDFVYEFALIPAAVAKFEVWRLLTYQFLHGGLMHIGINMLMLWMFGSELENRWGKNFFLKYYFICGIGGGILFTLVRWGTMVPSVGASGALYGILLAYGMWFPNRKLLVFFIVPVAAKHLVIFFIALEFLGTLGMASSGIAHAAHLGGMLFGYAYLRWWGVGGLTLHSLPSWSDIRRTWWRWRFRRLQRRRLGDKQRHDKQDHHDNGGPGPTLH